MAAAHHTARSATSITASVRTALQGGLDSLVYPGAVWALGDADGEQSSGALGVRVLLDARLGQTGSSSEGVRQWALVN